MLDTNGYCAWLCYGQGRGVDSVGESNRRGPAVTIMRDGQLEVEVKHVERKRNLKKNLADLSHRPKIEQWGGFEEGLQTPKESKRARKTKLRLAVPSCHGRR